MVVEGEGRAQGEEEEASQGEEEGTAEGKEEKQEEHIDTMTDDIVCLCKMGYVNK